MDASGRQPLGPPVTVDWTAGMAIKAVRGHAGLTGPEFAQLGRDDQIQAVRDAVDDDWLPEPAVDALVQAGWVELDPELDEG